MIQQMCKCCGKEIEIAKNARIATCPHCGKQQTLPLYRSQQREEQYAEICTLRQKGAFSAAIQRIEEMLQTDEKESEWYWQRLLCRYGMVYLQDTGKKEYILQCTNPMDVPISADADYQAAMRFAEAEAKSYYEADGTLLEQERQRELDVEQSEELSEFTLESGFRSLEAECWELASAQFDLVLRKRPNDSNAYLGKMMAQLQVRREEDLLNTGSAMEKTTQYAELMQHAAPAFREKILQYQKKAKYRQAEIMKEKANSVEALQAAIDLLESIPCYPDAERLAVVCKRQMRERMLAYSEVLIGCHAANHLILSGESEEKRIIVAKYYYDSDTEEEERVAAAAEKQGGAFRKIDGRIFFLLLVIMGLAVAVLIALFFRKESLHPNMREHHVVTMLQQTTIKTDVFTTESTTVLTQQVTVTDVVPIETEPTLSADAIVCGDYRYELLEQVLYRAEAVGSSAGQEKIQEQVQQIISDQEKRLLYLQNGTVYFLQADGTAGKPLPLEQVKALFSLVLEEGQTTFAGLTEDGTLSLWIYDDASGSYVQQTAFYLVEVEDIASQVHGWEAVVQLQLIDRVLIGMDQNGIPIRAVPLQF